MHVLGQHLLPRPQTITELEGEVHLASDGLVVLSVNEPGRLLGAARRLLGRSGHTWDIVASSAVPAADVRIQVQVSAAQVPEPEGYRLEARGTSVRIVAHDLAGARYGLDTATQLLLAGREARSAVRIDDHPSLLRRGFMLDISRDKVPTMETLLDVGRHPRRPAQINQLQLYTEHTFAYQQHHDGLGAMRHR